MKLIVGLGNPGLEYKNTRHNVGFMVLDAFAECLNVEFNKKKGGGIYFEAHVNGEKVMFLKPQKYINCSGEVIKEFVDYYKIQIKDILIIHDELDLQLGTYRLKIAGGNAGHNGLKSIESSLNTNEYKRLRIGIDNNKIEDRVDYVLSNFESKEKKQIKEIIEKSISIIEDFTILTFLNLMNKYNYRSGNNE